MLDEVEIHDSGKQQTDFEKENLLLLSTGNAVATRMLHSREVTSESHLTMVMFSTTPLPTHRMKTGLPRRYGVIRCNRTTRYMAPGMFRSYLSRHCVAPMIMLLQQYASTAAKNMCMVGKPISTVWSPGVR